MKRAFDLTVSVALLAISSPVMLLVAIAVRIDTPGPILFRQQRVGRNGQLFRIRKFRTMVVGGQGMFITPSNDPRITRVGHFLRRTKLDELPQLVDVIEGSMSLVGPRPEVPSYVDLWPDDLRHVILSVRPGITDPVTIDLRDESETLSQFEDPQLHYVDVLLPMKVEAYVRYIGGHSVVGDVGILLRTVRAVLVGPR